MSTLNDLILQVTGGPTVNDGLVSYFLKQADETLNDAEFKWLGLQGATADNINDRWMEYLTGLALTGTLNDMQYQYWQAALADPPSFILGSVDPASATNISAQFSKEIFSPTTDYATGFTINADAAPLTISKATLTVVPSRIEFVLTTPVTAGQTVTLSYNATLGDIEDLSATPLPTFTDQSVVNNL